MKLVEHSQVVVGLGHLRPQADGILIRLFGLAELMLERIDNPQVHVGIGVVRFELDRRPELLRGRLQLALRLQKKAEVVMRVHEIRAGRDGLLVSLLRLSQIVRFFSHRPQQVVGVGMVRPELDQASQQVLGRLALAL